MQPAMSAEGYRIRKLDQGTELITAPRTSNVEPFPVRKWNEPLPIAVEGRPIPHPNEEKSEAKPLTRFYPPLLLFSTTLTGVFLYLYLSKPVLVKEQSVAPPVAQVVAEASPESTSDEPVLDELSPWPEADMLSSNQLPGLTPLVVPEPSQPSMLPTTLGVEQIVKVESLNGELEEFSVSLPVLYPEDMLSWNTDSIAAAQELAVDIEAHLEKVSDIQANGVKLLEDWNRLVSQSVPQSVIQENNALSATSE